MFDLSFSCRESGRLGGSPPEVRKNPLSDRFPGDGARDEVSIGRHAHQHTPTYARSITVSREENYAFFFDRRRVKEKASRSNALPRLSSPPFDQRVSFLPFFFPPFFPSHRGGTHGSHHVQLALKRKRFYASRSIDPSRLPLPAKTLPSYLHSTFAVRQKIREMLADRPNPLPPIMRKRSTSRKVKEARKEENLNLDPPPLYF